MGVVGSSLVLGRLVEHLSEGFDLTAVVDLFLIELVLECFQARRVRRLGKLSLVVIRFERPEDVLRVVDEVQNERCILAGDHSVQPRQRLHRLHSI